MPGMVGWPIHLRMGEGGEMVTRSFSFGNKEDADSSESEYLASDSPFCRVIRGGRFKLHRIHEESQEHRSNRGGGCDAAVFFRAEPRRAPKALGRSCFVGSLPGSCGK
jgi:hypothetical protein